MTAVVLVVVAVDLLVDVLVDVMPWILRDLEFSSFRGETIVQNIWRRDIWSKKNISILPLLGKIAYDGLRLMNRFALPRNFLTAAR